MLHQKSSFSFNYVLFITVAVGGSDGINNSHLVALIDIII